MVSRITNSIEKRFWSKVSKKRYCWFWTGYKEKSGHGKFRLTSSVVIGAHRISWILFNKKMPTNMVLHKCNMPNCVNPKHLYDGTQAQNTRDSVKDGTHFEASKTHCNIGHKFTKGNTLIVAKGAKRCRECNRIRCLEYSRRRKWKQ